ncbi:MAG: helix-turn-helix transcriptional regulator [Planctomycetota bacterium]
MATNSVSEERLRKLLRELRLEHNLTQLEIAERTGHPQQVVSKIERGHRRLYATQLFEYVERGFGMSPTEFARRLEKTS